MSRPLAILRHQGHLEPTTARPGFTSTVINTVLTLRSLRLPAPFAWPAPPVLQAGNRAAPWVLGLLHPHTWVGTGQPWLRPETKPCEQWLPTVPWDCVWGLGKSSLSGRALCPPISLYEPLLPPQENSIQSSGQAGLGWGPPGPAGVELPGCPSLLAGSQDVKGMAVARDWRGARGGEVSKPMACGAPGSCSHSAIRKSQGLCPCPTCPRRPGLAPHS